MQVGLNNLEALAVLADCNDQHSWRGRPVASWVRAVGCDQSAAITSLEDENLDRKQLADFCCSSAHSDLDLFLAISAWGGMKVRHARSALEQQQTLLHDMRVLRTQVPTRRDAYNIFYSARANGRLKGVGPAYYTKLIFFVRPDLAGYIMDQWTARSVNVLAGQSVIRLGRENNVLDSNTADDYEVFCKIVESLASKLNIPPDVCEMKLFSHGGRNPGMWRAYVKRQGQDKFAKQ